MEIGCFIESVEDTNEVIRLLFWRQHSSNKDWWVEETNQVNKSVQDYLNVDEDMKEVGFVTLRRSSSEEFSSQFDLWFQQG